MTDFQKLCRICEQMTDVERGLNVTAKAVEVVAKLKALDIPGVRPVETLVAFIVGSAVADGKLDDNGYVAIAPSLEKAFGGECDIAVIKQSYKVSKDVRREVKRHAEQLMSVISRVDDDLADDIVLLCLLICSVDGKVTLKERSYVRQLGMI